MNAESGKGFSAYQVGQVVGAVSARYEARKTRPPERYTQASLIDDMLNAHKFAQDEAERKVLRETEGLGTSRTRETTITGLINRKYLVTQRKGKQHELISQEIARQIVLSAPQFLTSVATTAKWEVAFSMIEKGQVPPAAVIGKVHEMLHGLVDDARQKQKEGVISGAVGAAAPMFSARK